MKLLFTIYGQHPSLNAVLESAKQHHSKYSKEKKAHTDTAFFMAKAAGIKIRHRCKLLFVWHQVDARKDPDNVSFAKKYILDGMVKAGMLLNDGPRQIAGFSDHFEYGQEDKVEIFLID